MKNEDQVRKKRKPRRDDEDGETSEQEDASLNEEDKKKDAPAGDESDKKELPKKDGPAVPMATMMFPMTMMMPMMMPYPQGSVGAGATDEIPKKKKRGRPSKKSLAQQSTPTLNPADQSVPMPMWPFGMPLMPVGFKFPMNPIMVAPQVKGAKDQESTASSLLTKAGTVEEQSALKEGTPISPGHLGKMVVPSTIVVDDMKKKVRSTTGKPRGRPRTRPRPGDIITRPKLMNLAPAVIYDHMNGAHLDKDAKESGAEDDDDEEPHKSGERVV
ncbi:hypothetical protein Ae201684P_016443 [Aphanomyces euteiches]|uniref:Uncharacterized protein n=1 Tax=Aphanomyces euteiches TaxID=100861 RepID=A0A6G0XJP6_9STRA|nr:hypothetical protein Ae201684_004145 [Aphanomyces euteiches]KAH9093821.1 hypothetical protein Ae201684P_016443 [Aphanomyces euteiches]